MRTVEHPKVAKKAPRSGLLLFRYLATVDKIAHHVCDGAHIGCAPVTADASIPSIYTYRRALLVIKLTPPSARTSCVPEGLAVKLGYCRNSAIPQARNRFSVASCHRTCRARIGWAVPLAIGFLVPPWFASLRGILATPTQFIQLCGVHNRGCGLTSTAAPS